MRLRKVKTAQKVESSANTIMDDQENASTQGGIAKLDADEDVTLEDDTNKAEPAKVEEVIKVVTATKLMTEVVTTVATTITTAQVPKASAPRRRRGVVIQDPEETATASVIMHFEVKSKDKGNGILIEEPKPLKRQLQIKQDEAFTRQLEAKLNANSNWNDVLEQVERKEKKDNIVMRYQALKRKPITEAQARKNMRLEKKRQFKSLGLMRLRKVKTAQKAESSANTIMDDQENASTQGGIAKLDADEDVTLEDDTNKAEPAKVEEVIKVVTATKLMTEVVTTVATTITTAQVPKASAPRRRRGVVIQDPEETATASVIMHFEVKSKDKGNGILIEEPKPLKRQLQIKQDEAFTRQLEAKLNANSNWNDVLEQVERKEKKDNINMVGFKMNFFRGMNYNEIRPIFEKHYNLNQAFLKRVEEEVIGQKEEGNKRTGDSLNQDAAKKQRIDEETEELKTHLQIIANDDDDVYTEATPLALKVPVIDYQIHHEHNKPYYKIIKAYGTHQLFLSFITLLKNFNREDLEMLRKLV
nr:hypothetical protein [Tanacetum cinerariifolium]